MMSAAILSRALVTAARNAGTLRVLSAKGILSIADASLAKVSVAVRYAFARGRAALLRASKDRAADVAARAVADALAKTLPNALRATYVAGGELGAGQTSRRAAEDRAAASKPISIKFDPSNPRAAAWAREHAGDLIKGVSDVTRERVRDAVAKQNETGEFSYDDILDAVGDEERADLIARTETMIAASEGQREGWRQAVEAGELPDDMQRVWIVTPGCCDLCDELDGERADIDGEYPGGVSGPPLHPNCRCTEGLL